MLPRLSPSIIAALVLLLFSSRVEAVGIVDQADPHQIQYRVEGGPLRELAARFKPNELELIEKLNRTDLKHLPRLDRVVLPSEWRSELEHSPFPATYAAAATAPKLRWSINRHRRLRRMSTAALFTGDRPAPDARRNRPQAAVTT